MITNNQKHASWLSINYISLTTSFFCQNRKKVLYHYRAYWPIKESTRAADLGQVLTMSTQVQVRNGDTQRSFKMIGVIPSKETWSSRSFQFLGAVNDPCQNGFYNGGCIKNVLDCDCWNLSSWDQAPKGKGLGLTWDTRPNTTQEKSSLELLASAVLETPQNM